MNLAKQLNFSDTNLLKTLEDEFEQDENYKDLKKYNPEKY
jgi:hypothetical protein